MRPPSSDELHSFIRSRRSVRHFTEEPVSEESIRRILESAIRAPSAHNRQPWRFVLLTQSEIRQSVATAMGAEFHRALRLEGFSQEEAEARVKRSTLRIVRAPVVVILLLDRTEMDHYQDPERDQGERIMAVQSTAIAGGYILLGAAAEGLGGVWICAPLFTPGAIRDTLGLPNTWEPQAMLLLGYPEKQLPERSRRALDEVLRVF